MHICSMTVFIFYSGYCIWRMLNCCELSGIWLSFYTVYANKAYLINWLVLLSVCPNRFLRLTLPSSYCAKMYQNAPFSSKNLKQKNFWGGAQPPPQTAPTGEGNTPSAPVAPRCRAFGADLDPFQICLPISTMNLPPLRENSGYGLESAL